MSPSAFLWAIVFVVGVPSAWRNPTAGALVLCKIAGWAIYKLTGNSLPTEYYLYPDLFVVAIIFCKPDYKPCEYFRSTLHQLKCIATERSPADRAVLLIFVMMWATYVAPIDPYYVWWLLWGGFCLQFLFASAESLEIFWRSRSIVKRHIGDLNSLFAAFSGTSFLTAECAFVTVARGGGDG